MNRKWIATKMDDARRPKINRRVTAMIIAFALVFLAAGGILGLISGKEIRETLKYQFNAEQIVIARNVAASIEEKLDNIKKEIFLIQKNILGQPFAPNRFTEPIQDSFYRIMESGVWKIEIRDLKKRRTYIYRPNTGMHEKAQLSLELDELPTQKVLSEQTIQVSQPRINSSAAGLLLAMPVSKDGFRRLLFHVNISWLLAPRLKEIHSGKTGYAWIIDEKGIFLFHPQTEFIGENAFSARKEKNTAISFAKINFIQKEKMLKGFEGVGEYVSGWHRGVTGEIKKLIAYCPVAVAENPSQKWSVAVVAPASEIEGAVNRNYLRLLLFEGIIITLVLAGAAAILFMEKRWSRSLEEKVDIRTQALQKSEEKYRSLVESAEDFIFTVDLEGKFQSMNSFTAGFFGGRPIDFIGHPLSDVFPPPVADGHLKLIRLVFNLGKSIRDEFKMTLGDHHIWIDVNFMPLKTDAGNVHMVLCIARDVTEKKDLENQLVHAEKLASMGTLAAGVAHEINNPLGVILGFCDLLIQKTTEGTQDFDDLKTIERQGFHCKKVVQNLLSFSRLETSGIKFADLNACLEDILNIVRHSLEMNQIELATDLVTGTPLVKGDPRQLQQVFLNIINNAVAAMKGGGHLTIRTQLSKDRRWARIEFIDSGAGIAPEHMSRIYEPFFTTKPEGEGTGLGLFVSYGIVTKYGGTIDCFSRHAAVVDGPDCSAGTTGATFTVRLPITRREA